jgi:hypothetical protein
VEPVLRQTVRRSLYEIKTVVARYPRVALPIARRRHGETVGDDTDIVIEGFPRTGTTFAVEAFRMAQPERVEVACHVHAPAQLIAAAKRGIPALALVREPEDTVLSFVIRHSHIGIRQAVRGFVRFYEPLLPYADDLVVATFDDVTTDFGEVTRRVNKRFDTSFAEFEHTRENERRCFEAIDRAYAMRDERGSALEAIVARPSEMRRDLKDRLRGEYRAGRLSRLRGRAERAYRSLGAS